MKNIIIILIASLAMILSGCSSGKDKIRLDEEVKTRFDKGMYYLGKKRYLRAQEEFTFVVLSGSHTELGDDAQFYLAESYFLNEEYVQAISEYDQLIRKMPFTPFLQKARYRVCESYVEEAMPYYLDQTYSEKAIEKIQEFLDDYPESKHEKEATDLIKSLRNKLSNKLYETGILYIKLEEYTSAVFAFEEIVEKYFDTDRIGPAHVAIIQCHALKKDKATAEEYYSKVEIMLQALSLDEEARVWIAHAEPAEAEE